MKKIKIFKSFVVIAVCFGSIEEHSETLELRNMAYLSIGKSQSHHKKFNTSADKCFEWMETLSKVYKLNRMEQYTVPYTLVQFNRALNSNRVLQHSELLINPTFLMEGPTSSYKEQMDLHREDKNSADCSK